MIYTTFNYITVSGTGDKQKGFCRNGINSKASIDAQNILRGFFSFKVASSKRLYLACLRDYREIKLKSRLCRHLTTCTMRIYREWRNSRRISTPQRRPKSLLLEAMMSGKKLCVKKAQTRLTIETGLISVHNNGEKGSSVEGESPCRYQILPPKLNGRTQRVMDFFASCEQISYSKRFDSWNGIMSTLTLYMGGDFRSWGKGVVLPK